MDKVQHPSVRKNVLSLYIQCDCYIFPNDGYDKNLISNILNANRKDKKIFLITITNVYIDES